MAENSGDDAPREINTFNEFLVGIRDDQVVIIRPPFTLIPKKDALVFAAWIVALAEGEDGEFQRVLDAVRNT